MPPPTVPGIHDRNSKPLKWFLKAKLDPSNENIDNEVKSDVTHFLSQLYNETTEIKIFKNLQAYIVYNKDELSEKYKDKVIDI